MAPTALSERLKQSVTKDALRSYFAEFISTFFYVFAVVGSSMASTNISGGHVNPAVTFAKAVGGHISVLTALFYWVSQMLASAMACLVLKVTTVGQVVPTYTIAQEMTGFGASILEGLLTFALVYTVYAAGDPKRGAMGSIGPLAIGMIAGANVLATGPFSGGLMNPASAFGSAIVAGSFKNQAVYWVGPLAGAAVAGLVYDNVVFPAQTPPDSTLRGISDGIGL
ncbi:hypothetical protein LWI29_038357 [Acer saccharum]|uniref:Aquaporin TIP5-1 n=1 Tax=Acer saccharum TaxID=4024 RepID=A0AA39T015_ACESA|nr:hypothetical protein LWI29_038357 [Acer saccharum]